MMLSTEPKNLVPVINPFLNCAFNQKLFNKKHLYRSKYELAEFFNDPDIDPSQLKGQHIYDLAVAAKDPIFHI